MKKSLSVKKLCSTLAVAGFCVMLGYTGTQIVRAQSNLPPINSSGVVVIDLPASTAESIRLDIKQGRFASQSVGRLVLDAQGIDFKKGSLNSLGAEVSDGNFDNVLVDSLKMNTQAFSFDTLELLNHRRFVLDHPVNASVALKISEESFNRIVASPKTLEKLEKAVAKKTGNISLIQFSNPSIKFMDRNRVKFSVNSSLANAVGAPMEFTGKLGVEKGKLSFNGLKMTSNGVQLPVDVSDIVQKKLNELIDLEKLGKSNFVIRAQDLSLNKGMMEVRGMASLNRLEFGN